MVWRFLSAKYESVMSAEQRRDSSDTTHERQKRMAKLDPSLDPRNAGSNLGAKHRFLYHEPTVVSLTRYKSQPHPEMQADLRPRTGELEPEWYRQRIACTFSVHSWMRESTEDREGRVTARSCVLRSPWCTSLSASYSSADWNVAMVGMNRDSDLIFSD